MTALSEGQHLGAYRIVRLLGEGGMGAVYEARQEPLDRRVAVKTLHPEFARNQDAVARFFNEAKILSKLEHPSIVQVSDFGQSSDGITYLVMEYLRGESLRRRLSKLRERNETLPLLVVLQIAWQVADVLAVAHSQGIVHRDLKPDNLMLVADPIAPGGERVKVLDFGIAKLTRPDDKGSLKTDTHAVMGTPLYMSPEQCAGAGGVDAKTDVYSLACVMFEALAGRAPFIADGPGQVLGMHLFQTPPSLSSLAPKLPADATALVHRMLTKDKALRPSMSQVADELGVLLSRLPNAGSVVRSRSAVVTDPDATRALPALRVLSTLGASLGQVTATPARRIWLVAMSVVGLLLLALGLGAALRPSPSIQPQLTSAAPPTPVVAPSAPDTNQPVQIRAASEVTVPLSDGTKPAKDKGKPAAQTQVSPNKQTGTAKTDRGGVKQPTNTSSKPSKPKAFDYEN